MLIAILNVTMAGMVLCEWEGCGKEEIDDDQLTWQPVEHFESNWLRKHIRVLTEFRDFFENCDKVQKKKLTWPLSKASKHVVICKPGFEWVKKHPSLKTRLKFSIAK